MHTLIVGDVTEDLATWVLQHFPLGQLLTDNKFDYLISNVEVLYTSAADLSDKNFTQAILKANRIIFKDPNSWSDFTLKDKTYRAFYYSNKIIENFSNNLIDSDHGNLLDLCANRKSTDRQVWIAGCSFAHGTGVVDQERYGEIFANSSLLPVSFLTYPGTSIPWAADQILRSDIKKADIILWGLTSINRFDTYKNNQVLSIIPNTFSCDWKELYNKLHGIDNKETTKLQYNKFITHISALSRREKKELELATVSNDRLMQAIKSIFQVINFCKQLDVKLILFLHNLSTIEFEYFLIKYIALLDNFIFLSPIIDVDVLDTQHPGPNTHRNWANELIHFAKEKKYI